MTFLQEHPLFICSLGKVRRKALIVSIFGLLYVRWSWETKLPYHAFLWRFPNALNLNWTLIRLFDVPAWYLLEVPESQLIGFMVLYRYMIYIVGPSVFLMLLHLVEATPAVYPCSSVFYLFFSSWGFHRKLPVEGWGWGICRGICRQQFRRPRGQVQRWHGRSQGHRI